MKTPSQDLSGPGINPETTPHAITIRKPPGRKNDELIVPKNYVNDG
jgi:hypothetical protein